jgi:hypothetical protein
VLLAYQELKSVTLQSQLVQPDLYYKVTFVLLVQVPQLLVFPDVLLLDSSQELQAVLNVIEML